MEKNYDHRAVEKDMYQRWQENDQFLAKTDSTSPSFTISLPPPNVTGQLHLGHAAMLAIEDILVRYKKMAGFNALWVPGTDHAAIATENVVLKHLGLVSREKLSREKFLQECRKFAQTKHNTICNQTKRMGSALDWSREAYTFDDARNFAVNKIFKNLYDDGLIERGHRMINWSTGAQSVISDDELEWEDLSEPFYYIRCGEFVVGTVRPETKCADSPVVVHPKGKYVRAEFSAKNGTREILIFTKKLYEDTKQRDKIFNILGQGSWKILETLSGADMVGQKFNYQTYAGERSFEVLADEIIDIKKGTGAMTISSNHSADDFDLTKRKKLDKFFIKKIDFSGRMTKIAGDAQGLLVAEARIFSAQKMREMNLLIGIDKTYSHRVPKCYRSECIIEPMISPQWFVLVDKEFRDKFTGNITTLKKITQDAVRQEDIKIIPNHFKKTYFHWIDNLRDWCISRQIWWGHRIPVWYDQKNNEYLSEEQRILFVRHGESEANSEGLINGGLDTPLTPNGHRQAQKLVKQLQKKKQKISRVFCSPRKRAQETAQKIAQQYNVPVEILPDLDEFRTGNNSRTLRPTNLSARERIDFYVKMPKAESLVTFFARVRKIMDYLKNLPKEEGDIVVVSHGFWISAALAIYKGHTAHSFRDFRSANWQSIENCDVREVGFFVKPRVGVEIEQDKDTLDTWFSSALWPFSILGWPDASDLDYKKFYPNDVLETGHDILFFWVARMLMFGKYATGVYPFHTVYLHGLVCDEKGKKMSKSRGNGIDPLEMIEKYGADAVRMSLVVGTSPGNSIPLGDAKIAGFRNFTNKIWNAGRFVKMKCGDKFVRTKKSPAPKTLAERWIFSRFSAVCTKVKADLDQYKISSAGDAVYHFFWDEFCDWFIEASKDSDNKNFLQFIFGEIIKLLHPMCPFATEKIRAELGLFEGRFLLQERFLKREFSDQKAEKQFGIIQRVITEIRKLKTENKVVKREKISVTFVCAKKVQNFLEENEDLLSVLLPLKKVSFASHKPQGKNFAFSRVEGIDIFIDIPFDLEAEKKRLQTEIKKISREIESLESRLSSKNYLTKAPPALVQESRGKLRNAQEKLQKLKKELISNLNSSFEA